MRKLFLIVSMVFLLGTSLASSPCPAQQFWGTVSINGQPAPSGLLVEAKISGIVVNSALTDGDWYGNPNVFYITSCSQNQNTIVKFYVKGVYAGETIFYPYASVRFDLSFSTVCGNSVCEPGEDSGNCCIDCGCPSGSCVDNVCVLPENTPVNGGGGGGFIVTGTQTNESYCGDGICDLDETCSSCVEDCGKCPAECEVDPDCDDGNPCTIESCDEGACYYTPVGCQNNDGCCPSGCSPSNDDDCPVENQGDEVFPPISSKDKAGQSEEIGSLTGFAAIPPEMVSIVSAAGLGVIIIGGVYFFFLKKA